MALKSKLYNVLKGLQILYRYSDQVPSQSSGNNPICNAAIGLSI